MSSRRNLGLRERLFFTQSSAKTCAFGSKSTAKVALRVLERVEAIPREPFVGVGKPEPLRHLLAGAWSRRITEEHRLVYLVRDDRIDFLQARYHH